MPTIRDVEGILKNNEFAKVELVHLPRAKPQGNRSKAKTFANQIEKQLSGFQDSDVVVVALTVNHGS